MAEQVKIDQKNIDFVPYEPKATYGVNLSEIDCKSDAAFESIMQLILAASRSVLHETKIASERCRQLFLREKKDKDKDVVHSVNSAWTFTKCGAGLGAGLSSLVAVGGIASGNQGVVGAANAVSSGLQGASAVPTAFEKSDETKARTEKDIVDSDLRTREQDARKFDEMVQKNLQDASRAEDAKTQVFMR